MAEIPESESGGSDFGWGDAMHGLGKTEHEVQAGEVTFQALTEKLEKFGVDSDDGRYLNVPTNDPELGTIGIDSYYNAFHSRPDEAGLSPILAIQRAVEPGVEQPVGYNYFLFHVGDLNPASFATEPIAAAIQGHAAGELVLVTDAENDRYRTIDPNDPQFLKVVGMVTAYEA